MATDEIVVVVDRDSDEMFALMMKRSPFARFATEHAIAYRCFCDETDH